MLHASLPFFDVSASRARLVESDELRRRLPIAAVRHILDVRVQWDGRKYVVRNGRRQSVGSLCGGFGRAGYGHLTVPEVQRCGASALRGSGPILYSYCRMNHSLRSLASPVSTARSTLGISSRDPYTFKAFSTAGRVTDIEALPCCNDWTRHLSLSPPETAHLSGSSTGGGEPEMFRMARVARRPSPNDWATGTDAALPGQMRDPIVCDRKTDRYRVGACLSACDWAHGAWHWRRDC